jgi:hypothetical protein
MASNQLPKGLDPLLTLGEDLADGLHAHETKVGVKLNPEAAVRAGTAALRAAEARLQTARADRKTLVTAQTVADSNGRAFLGKARKAIALHLGDRWSAAWLPTGFPNQSTAVPDTLPARQELLAKLKAHFTATPAHQLPDQGVTAAQADALFQALSDARAADAEKEADVGTKKLARDTAEAALRTRLSNAMAELGQLLASDDPRWQAFGLNMPGDPDTPERVEGMVVTPTVPGTLYVDWADARRAERYRVWLQIVGTDAEFRNVVTRDENDANPHRPAQRRDGEGANHGSQRRRRRAGERDNGGEGAMRTTSKARRHRSRWRLGAWTFPSAWRSAWPWPVRTRMSNATRNSHGSPRVCPARQRENLQVWRSFSGTAEWRGLLQSPRLVRDYPCCKQTHNPQ